MPIINRVAEMQNDIKAWRHHLHAIPELHFDLHETSSFVEKRLISFGCDEIVTGVAGTGIVATIEGRLGFGPTIALRADMDALPITERTGVSYSSQAPGKMHACGHDGHTAMLLGAASYLAETRSFSGKVVLIFQPDEEGGYGAKQMLEEKLIERFGIERVFGMHNKPGLAVGTFAIRNGATMAGTTEFFVTITGVGGHAAQPHKTVDPIVVGGYLLTALQSIVSRSIDPIDSAVVSVTKFHAGDALNVIAERAELAGTIRTLNSDTAKLIQDRIRGICAHVSATFGARIHVDFEINAPATVNSDDEVALSIDVATFVVGDKNVDRNIAPSMGGEDFAYMLEAIPGSYIYIGNGASAYLHQPDYNFNDEAIPFGVSYWIKLVESTLGREAGPTTSSDR